MGLTVDERNQPDPSQPSSVSTAHRFSLLSSRDPLPAQSAPSDQQPKVSFGPGVDLQHVKSNTTARNDPGQTALESQPGRTKLLRRNSLKLPKRISSSSLLPINYSNKKGSSSSSQHSPLRNKAPGGSSFYRSVIYPYLMALNDRIMARKGYWFRNGAILAFCLTLFFYVMLPRRQPDAHNNAGKQPSFPSYLV